MSTIKRAAEVVPGDALARQKQRAVYLVSEVHSAGTSVELKCIRQSDGKQESFLYPATDEVVNPDLYIVRAFHASNPASYSISLADSHEEALKLAAIYKRDNFYHEARVEPLTGQVAGQY